MGNWTEHGAGSGGYYKCNKYDGKVGGALDDAERAKVCALTCLCMLTCVYESRLCSRVTARSAVLSIVLTAVHWPVEGFLCCKV
jgi:hypothetical protein